MKLKVIIIFFLHSTILNSQNLVINPGFEEYFLFDTLSFENRKKYTSWVVEIPANWTTVKGTVDFYGDSFSRNYYTNYKTGVNSFGEVNPISGNNCMGAILGKEIFGGKLVTPLIKDSLYYISLYINLNIHSKKGVKYLNFTFLNEEIVKDTKEFYLNHIVVFDLKAFEHQTSKIKIGKKNSKRNKWIQVKSYYKAKGDERFFYIGIQSLKGIYTSLIMGSKRPKENHLKKRDFNGYYYFDDICITLANEPNCNDEEIDTILESENTQVVELKKITLENLEFEINSFRLMNESKKKLDFILPELLSYENNDSILIYIYGHTDNTGSENFNLTLSQNRANSVKEYLIENGLSNVEIISVGLGSTKPLFTNETEVNRNKNRRVEIVVTKKKY